MWAKKKSFYHFHVCFHVCIYAVRCALMLVCWAANVVHMIDSGKVWKYETSMDLNKLCCLQLRVKFCICLLHTGSLKGKCFTETFCRNTTNAHCGLQIAVTTKCSLWLIQQWIVSGCVVWGKRGCQTFQASFSSLPEVSYPFLNILNSLNKLIRLHCW